MRLKNPDLIVALLIALVNVGWALLPIRLTIIGIILALPLVFILPGYTLTEVLFHKRSLRSSDRLIFSLGLSLAIDVLSGLILNALPGGLQAPSWAILLAVFTTAFSLIAMLLRRRAPLNTEQAAPRFHLKLSAALPLGLAAAVLILSLLYSIIGAQQQRYPGFTQLWLLPASTQGQPCAVSMGVQNFEATVVTYRVRMTINEAQVTTWSPLVLAPQQEWKQVVPVSLAANGTTSVDVQLYRLDNPQSVYRQVHLTVYKLKGKNSNTCTSG